MFCLLGIGKDKKEILIVSNFVEDLGKQSALCASGVSVFDPEFDPNFLEDGLTVYFKNS